jgi:predicted ArsR family transcriptional regulator
VRKEEEHMFYWNTTVQSYIIHIAEKHWEACSVETELFEKLLDAKIETTHRAAKGDLICKFLIKKSKEGYDYL